MKTDTYGGDISWLQAADEAKYFRVLNAAKDYSESGTRNGMHLNGPYPLHLLGKMLIAIDEHQEHLEQSGQYSLPAARLLDAGCGAGQLVLLASAVFNYGADGFDLDEKYIRQGTHLIQEMGEANWANVWVQDATKFDRYGDYDIVILNKLFVGPMQQSELEAKVQNELKPGGYLIKLNNVTPVNSGMGFELILSDGLGGCVVRKLVT